MDIKSQLEQDLKNAMRQGSVIRRDTLRMAIAAMKNAEIEKGEKLDDVAYVNILQKEIKSRRETILDAEKANRPNIIEACKQEISVLEEYLPKQLTEDELLKMISETIVEIQALSPNDTGRVMKLIMPKVAGRAPGDIVSQLVRKALTQSK